MDTEKKRGGEKETERDIGNKDITKEKKRKKQKERCGIREYDIEKYKDM